jgi:hypothetical protein
MKKLVILLSLLTLVLGLFAQEPVEPAKEEREFKTILGDSEDIGGYGGFGVEYGQVDKLDAVFFNGKAALIPGHNMAMGLAGKGFVTDYYKLGLADSYNLAGGYGGLFIEPIIFPNFPVHVSVPLFFGVGGLALLENMENDNYQDEDDNVVATDVFLLFEPGVEIQLNITHFFRIAMGGYYRLPSSLGMDVDSNYPSGLNVGTKAIEGFSGGITFKFGKF